VEEDKVNFVWRNLKKTEHIRNVHVTIGKATRFEEMNVC
jgi:hypothetical protein